MGRYDWVTNEMFHRKLEEILDATSTVELIAVPGVYMALCEHFNNDVLDTLTAEHPWLGEGFQAGEDTDDRGDAFLFAYHEQAKVGAIDYGGIWVLFTAPDAWSPGEDPETAEIADDGELLVGIEPEQYRAWSVARRSPDHPYTVEHLVNPLRDWLDL